MNKFLASKNKNLKLKNQGFSFIEAMAVIAVIAVLSVISFPFYQDIRKNLALDRASIKLAQDIRTAQEMAMSAQEFGGVLSEGYGLYFSTSNTSSYIIFADNNGNGEYDGASSIVETVLIESRILIDNIYSFDELCIVYFPPEPTVSLKYKTGGGSWIDAGDNVSIDLKMGDETRTVKVNKAGLVEID